MNTEQRAKRRRMRALPDVSSQPAPFKLYKSYKASIISLWSVLGIIILSFPLAWITHAIFGSTGGWISISYGFYTLFVCAIIAGIAAFVALVSGIISIVKHKTKRAYYWVIPFSAVVLISIFWPLVTHITYAISPAGRINAAYRLASKDPEEAILVAQKYLRNDQGKLRRQAVYLLSRIEGHNDVIVPILIEAVETADIYHVTQDYLRLLDKRRKDDPRVLPFLVTYLENDNRSIRETASDVISSHGADALPAVPALLKALDKEHYGSNIPQTLSFIGFGAYEQLAEVLDTGSNNQILGALHALGRMSHGNRDERAQVKKILPRLIELTDHASPQISQAAELVIERWALDKDIKL